MVVPGFAFWGQWEENIDERVELHDGSRRAGGEGGANCFKPGKSIFSPFNTRIVALECPRLTIQTARGGVILKVESGPVCF